MLYIFVQTFYLSPLVVTAPLNFAPLFQPLNIEIIPQQRLVLEKPIAIEEDAFVF